MFSFEVVWTTPQGEGHFFAGAKGLIYSSDDQPFNYHYCPANGFYRCDELILIFRPGHFPILGTLPLEGIGKCLWRFGVIRVEKAPPLLWGVANGLAASFDEDQRQSFPSFIPGFRSAVVDLDFVLKARPGISSLLIRYPDIYTSP